MTPGRLALHPPLGHLVLDDCRVENIVGEVGKGFTGCDQDAQRRAHRHWRADDRPGAGPHSVSHARVCKQQQVGEAVADSGRAEVRPRGDGGRGGNARLRWSITPRLRAMRALPFVTESAMCKYFSSQVAERVASKAVEVLGGVGFTKDYPVEKLYSDAGSGASTKARATCG